MRKHLLIGTLTLCLFTASCKSQQGTRSQEDTNEAVAFPGAEGFGKYTRGGRGGRVIVVSNLNDDGPGSFRQAATAKGARVIVFAVSGTIHLQSPLGIKGDVTIAGQTAPGDGICLADHPVKIDGDNVIVRYLRFRMGDRFQSQKGKVSGSGSDDAFSANRKKHLIIDHCSMSWSTDEVFSVYGGDSTTLQWNLISEPLNYSYHFETGDTDFERHGYGGIWGGQHLSAHHNLFAHCNSRNPRFNGARLGAEEELVHFSNNVIYNWGHNSSYGGEGGRYNLVNNYYKAGPSTSKSVMHRIVNPSQDKDGRTGQFYVQGNVVDGSPAVSRNNWDGIEMDKKAAADVKRQAVTDQPFTVVPVELQTAEQAYESVLRYVGASFRRDTLDQRICNDVRNRTGRIIDVQGGFPHATPYELTVNAWPTLTSSSAPADSDGDGMPDAWEKKNGLDPSSAADASTFTLNKHYSNIEVYINSLLNQKS